MTFGQALLYFLREAMVNLLRSWKVSLVAVATIAVSLTLAGVFLVLGGNLAAAVERWQEESLVVVYLEPGIESDAADALAAQAAEAPFVRGVERVDPNEARARFVRSFPSMADLLEGWGEEPLPTSLEVDVDWRRAGDERFTAWADALRTAPAVTMVDDDRDWLRQLEAVVLVLRGLGLVVGITLLLTAVFTIASVIRLTAYLYRDEIAVMRLVGATEFFIRGPFYAEGLLQGIAGGTLAVALLAGVHAWVLAQHGGQLLTAMLAGDFLAPLEVLALVAAGGLAGLVGAVTSLEKESLGEIDQDERWPSG